MTRGLRKQYGAHAALDGVDMEVTHGSVYGLVGPNGSGKTTLLSILAGLRRPTEGECSINVPRERVVLAPDTPQFEPWLTAREVVALAYSLVLGTPPPERVEQTLDEAGLTDALDRRVGGFSRGMLQRLGLAAALVADPELLLLDEPAAALDPMGRREVLDLIARERGSRTVVFSSHILSDVQEVCDTVGILRNGRLLYQGPLAQLLTGSAAPHYLVRLRDRPDQVAQVLRDVPWVRSVDISRGGAIRVAVSRLEDAECGLPAALARANARVVSFRPGEASLEEVFLEITT
ncbi:MAG: ABC transporter ATP-binding protein [Dehalococcoidia bacterium]